MKLVAVPNIQLSESPASWLSRVALSQHVSISRLFQRWGIDSNRDIDFAFSNRSIQEVANRLTEAEGDFRIAESMLARLRTIDPRGERFLLRQSGNARYRFCAQCMAENPTKYLRLEWRFDCWLWCPLHNCYLESKCPHCNAMVTLPVDMQRGGLKRDGIDTLERCFHCGKLLTANWRSRAQTIDRTRLSSLDVCLLNNGRAVLAALFHGHVGILDNSRRYSLEHLVKLHMRGIIPQNWEPRVRSIEQDVEHKSINFTKRE